MPAMPPPMVAPFESAVLVRPCARPSFGGMPEEEDDASADVDEVVNAGAGVGERPVVFVAVSVPLLLLLLALALCDEVDCAADGTWASAELLERALDPLEVAVAVAVVVTREGPGPGSDAEGPTRLGFGVTSKCARTNSSPRLTIASVCWPCEARPAAAKNRTPYRAPATSPGAVYRAAGPPSTLYSETCAAPGASRGRTTPKTDIVVPGQRCVCVCDE